MSIYARIQDGVVFELFVTDLDMATLFPPNLIWVNVDNLDGVAEGWVANEVDGEWVISPYVAPPADPVYLSIMAKQERESLLRSIYDPGILMAQRALRMAATTQEKAYAEGKISELDAYAEALLAIPDQEDFPQTIIWPAAPTK